MFSFVGSKCLKFLSVCRENCEKKAAKVIRQFYKRPYFVPPMVELGEANWIFIARDFKAKRPKLVKFILVNTKTEI